METESRKLCAAQKTLALSFSEFRVLLRLRQKLGPTEERLDLCARVPPRHGLESRRAPEEAQGLPAVSEHTEGLGPHILSFLDTDTKAF
jgi:hypothetical protein